MGFKTLSRTIIRILLGARRRYLVNEESDTKPSFYYIRERYKNTYLHAT
jgi:hypothetical protein